MKSPISGKKMVEVTRREMLEYKGIWITYDHTSWYDEHINDYFTTTEQDEINLDRVKGKVKIIEGEPIRI